MDNIAWENYMNQGAAAYQRGNEAEAARLFALALEELDKTGIRDYRLIATLGNIAAVCQSLKMIEEAQSLYLRAIDAYDQFSAEEKLTVKGMDHVLRNLAMLSEDQGKYTEAAHWYERCLQIEEKRAHFAILSTLRRIMDLSIKDGSQFDVAPFYERSLQRTQAEFGPIHANVAVSHSHLAALYRLQGRHIQAEQLYRQALAIVERLMTAGNVSPRALSGYELNDLLTTDLLNLAMLYVEKQEVDQAEEFFQRLLKLATDGSHHPLLPRAIREYASLLRHTNRPVAAEKLEAMLKARGVGSHSV